MSIWKWCKKIYQKKLAIKNVTNNHDVSNVITNVSNDHITMKTINPNTKDKLSVTALIAIMEPVTESQSSRAYKQPLRSHPNNNKIKVLLDSGSNGDLYFLQKGKDKPFPYLTRQAPKSWRTSNGSCKQMEEASLDSSSLSILLAGSTSYNTT